MKIGVAIPMRNSLRFIENTMNSVTAQTYPCTAYVFDDASTDGGWEFIDVRWHDHIREHHLERRGWPFALNMAMSLAINDGCDAVFMLNADDWLRLDCIEKCVEALEEGYDWAVVYSQQVNGRDCVQTSMIDATLDDFTERSPLTNYAMIRSEQWLEVGGYSTDISLPNSWGNYEDWEFWIKMLKAGFTDYKVVEEPVYFNRMHSGQLHLQGLGRVQEQKALIMKKHPDLAWGE